MLGTVLRYDYEVRDEKEVAGTVPSPKIPKEMLQLASHILDTMAGHFDPSRFKDEFEMELRKLVKRKASGKPIEYAERREKPSDVVDLMAALRQSVEGGKRSAPKPEGRCARGAVKPLANGESRLKYRTLLTPVLVSLLQRPRTSWSPQGHPASSRAQPHGSLLSIVSG
jgi:hypothetical protein